MFFRWWRQANQPTIWCMDIPETPRNSGDGVP